MEVGGLNGNPYNYFLLISRVLLWPVRTRKVYLDENSSLHLRTEVTTRKYEPNPAHNEKSKSYNETAETTFVEAGDIEDVVNLTLMVFHFVFFCLSIFFNKNETSKLVKSYWYSDTCDLWPWAPLAHLKILVWLHRASSLLLWLSCRNRNHDQASSLFFYYSNYSITELSRRNHNCLLEQYSW